MKYIEVRDSCLQYSIECCTTPAVLPPPNKVKVFPGK